MYSVTIVIFYFLLLSLVYARFRSKYVYYICLHMQTQHPTKAPAPLGTEFTQLVTTNVPQFASIITCTV